MELNEISSSWEGHRKKAKKLEGELDVKLASFAKLCLTYDGRVNSQTEDKLTSKVEELDSLLVQLEKTNESMRLAVSETDSRAHTVARHRDILREFVQEAERLKSTVTRAKTRAQVLAEDSEDAPLMGVQVQSTTGALLRERATLHSATVGINEVIDQATNISDEFKSQGGVFHKMSSRLSELGMKYPVVNSLLRSISRRKSRDTIILSLVVASCLTFVILYLFWR